MEWKQFSNTKYIVSNTGLVKNSITGKTLKPYDNGKGYKKVSLSHNGKIFKIYVHRLVALLFVEGFKVGLTVDHVDGNKDNNNFHNLEWVTLEENVRRMHVMNMKKINRRECLKWKNQT